MGWDYIKRQFWFVRNQSQLVSKGVQASQIIQPASTARDIEASIILTRLRSCKVTINKKKVVIKNT